VVKSELIEKRTPVGRLGRPDEIANDRVAGLGKRRAVQRSEQTNDEEAFGSPDPLYFGHLG
jgi:hypothetical protein